MRIVLDTNILLTIISDKAALHNIFLAFLDEKYILCVTTDILLEYEEVIQRHLGKETAYNVMQLLENAPNVMLITRYYAWNLITKDPDDNKFVDCAITAKARYIVTEDKHFRILKKIPFPIVDCIKAVEFSAIVKEMK